jgi:hypothetical protein
MKETMCADNNNNNHSAMCLLQNIVEGNIFTIVQAFQLVAHVFEEKTVLLGIHCKSSLQQSQDELHLESTQERSSHWSLWSSTLKPL